MKPWGRETKVKLLNIPMSQGDCEEIRAATAVSLHAELKREHAVREACVLCYLQKRVYALFGANDTLRVNHKGF